MNDNALDFAYRYPFSDEAKRIVEKQEDRINIKYLDMAAKHIDNALAGNLTYKEIKMDSIRLDYVMAYLYSRLLLSAVKRRDIIKSYALAEARRSAEILPLSDDSDVKRIAAELGIEMNSSFDSVRSNRQNEFAMSFMDYVNNTPKDKGFALVNQKLSNGVVLLNKTQLSRIIERAIEGEISKGLPIKSSQNR
jgi:DNA primase large subunit